MPEVSSVTVPWLFRGAVGPGIGRISLPKPLTSFIGRERELAQAKRLLQGSYLVTLTGPGGSGKTRLCIALAAAVAGDYPDGVYFVPLAPVRDPGLVPSTIAQSIGLQDARDRPLMEHLVSQLRERAAPDRPGQLRAPAGRRPGRDAAAAGDERAADPGQQPLAAARFGRAGMPGPAAGGPGAGRSPDGRLAGGLRVGAPVHRAGRPPRCRDSPSTTRTPPAIAEIARRLDGLPLAIELAAARVKLLPPEAILPRLEHSLSLLTGGSRDLPDRQQTLRATIAWSYDLLTEGARRLLATCSVFAGGAQPGGHRDGLRRRGGHRPAGARWPAGAGRPEPAAPGARPRERRRRVT